MINDELLKSAGILLVDDEDATLRLLEKMLRRAGYTRISGTTDSLDVARLVAQDQPDLILLDLLMPGKSGLEVLEDLRSIIPGDEYLPVIVLTGDARPEPRLQALLAGAKDFLTKPFDQFEVMLRIHNLLEARFLFRELRDQATRTA
jgi:CheY-like chemotaxis protein